MYTVIKIYKQVGVLRR